MIVRVVESWNDDAAADINDASRRTGESTDVCIRSYGDDSLASNSDGLCPWARRVAREDLPADKGEIRRLLSRPDGRRRESGRESGHDPATE